MFLVVGIFTNIHCVKEITQIRHVLLIGIILDYRIWQEDTIVRRKKPLEKIS